MHLRFAPIAVIAAISVLAVVCKTDVRAEDGFGGQAILVECPVWKWKPSSIPGVEYELCFDDFDHCTVADIGDTVCIPSLGVHAAWVSAIDYQSGEIVVYDGDIAPIERLKSADFTHDDVVGIADMGVLIELFGTKSDGPADLDGDGVIGILDFDQFVRAFGKCVHPSGTVYESC